MANPLTPMYPHQAPVDTGVSGTPGLTPDQVAATFLNASHGMQQGLAGGVGDISAEDITSNNISANDIGMDPATMAKQNAFVQALQQQAAGGGPNPAAAAMQQALQSQAANTNAMISGNRGVNAGMALRQGLQSQAQGTQGIAGQTAVQSAQQQLNAQGMLGNSLMGMQQQNLGMQGQNQQANLAASQANQAAALEASRANQGANLAAQQANQQGTLTQRGQNIQQQMGQAQIDQADRSQNKQIGSQVVGGIAGGLGSAMNFLAQGGVVKLAEGGSVPLSDPSSPTSFAGKFLKGVGTSMTATPGQLGLQSGISSFMGSAFGSPKPSATPAYNPGGQTDDMGVDTTPVQGPGAFARGGAVPAKVSPGEVYVPPSKVNSPNPLKAGERIPGKAKVKGDSYANDTVSKTLQAGGIVIPRHITQAENAPERAAEFVRAVLAKQGLKR